MTERGGRKREQKERKAKGREIEKAGEE